MDDFELWHKYKYESNLKKIEKEVCVGSCHTNSGRRVFD